MGNNKSRCNGDDHSQPAFAFENSLEYLTQSLMMKNFDICATFKQFQKLYEQQVSTKKYIEPTELIDLIQEIIEKLEIENVEVEQKKFKVFKYKERVPVKQFFALYAINKISTIANEN